MYVDWEIMTATYILMAVGLFLPDKKVMVVFLEFWYKWYKVDDNRFLYHLLIIISMALTSMSRNLLLEHIKDMYL